MFINWAWLAYILQIRTNQDSTLNAVSLDAVLFLNISVTGREVEKRQREGGMEENTIAACSSFFLSEEALLLLFSVERRVCIFEENIALLHFASNNRNEMRQRTLGWVVHAKLQYLILVTLDCRAASER